MTAHERLVDLLREDRHGEALALARACASRAEWDRLIAATLVLHGEVDDPLHAEAIARLGAAVLDADAILADQARVAHDVLQDPGDWSRWIALVGSLVCSGRAHEAFVGLDHAARLGAPPALWHAVCDAAASLHDLAAVSAVLEHGHRHHPGDPRIGAAVAMARLSRADLAGARDAVERTLAADDAVDAGWIASAHVAIAEGDRDRAREAIVNARLLGAPKEALRGLVAALADER